MNHWMFRCRDVSQKVSQSMDEPLPFSQRMAVWIHLMMCRYCRRFQRQLIALRKISGMEDMGDSIDEASDKLSEDAKTRIKEKLRSLP